MRDLKNMQNKFKKAFTLAEVLITVGAIAIVAIMTIPMVVNSYQKRVTVTKVRESFTILSDAFSAIEDDCGHLYICLNPGGGNAIDTSNDAELVDRFKQQLPIAQDCTDGVTTGCFANTTYLLLNGDNFVNPETSGGISSTCRFPNARFVLTNGMAIGFDLYQTNRLMVSAYIYVDINNTQGPNQLGKDTFVYIYRTDINTFTPLTFGNDCTSTGAGYSCSAKVIQENNITYY